MTEKHVKQIFKKHKIQIGIQIEFQMWLKSWQTSTLTTTDASSDQIQKNESHQDTQFNIVKILKLSSQGRSILEIYNINQQLNDGSRSLLVELIVNYMIQNDMKMTIPIAEKIKDNILTIFPEENAVILFFFFLYISYSQANIF